MKNEKTCRRCENRNFKNCSTCHESSNFYSSMTYEEWKKQRKEKKIESKH